MSPLEGLEDTHLQEVLYKLPISEVATLCQTSKTMNARVNDLLRSYTLSDPDSFAADLKWLSRPGNHMQTLNISVPELEDSLYQSIGKMDDLRELNLQGAADLDDETFKQIAPCCQKIKSLMISTDNLTDESGALLANGFPELRNLILNQVDMDETLISIIRNHPKLNTLGIEEIQLTDELREAISDLYFLRSIDLMGTGANDHDIEEMLKRLDHIQKIKLGNFVLGPMGKITDKTLHALVAKEFDPAPLLELTLDSTSVTAKGLKETLHKFKKLQLFSLTCTNFGDRITSTLNTLENLNELKLELCSITDAGIDVLKKNTKIEKLNLYGNEITDRGITQIVEKFPNLRELNIGNNPLTKASLEAIKKLHYLERLEAGDLSI